MAIEVTHFCGVEVLQPPQSLVGEVPDLPRPEACKRQDDEQRGIDEVEHEVDVVLLLPREELMQADDVRVVQLP